MSGSELILFWEHKGSLVMSVWGTRHDEEKCLRQDWEVSYRTCQVWESIANVSLVIMHANEQCLSLKDCPLTNPQLIANTISTAALAMITITSLYIVLFVIFMLCFWVQVKLKCKLKCTSLYSGCNYHFKDNNESTFLSVFHSIFSQTTQKFEKLETFSDIK